MADEFIGIGTELKRGDGGGPETFTTIANVGDIDGPNESVDTVEVTSNSSPNQTRQYIAGLRNSGQVTFPVNWVPSNQTHQNLKADFDARVVRNFQLVWPDSGNATLDFAGIITNFGWSSPLGDKVTGSITIQVTGAPTLTL